MVYRLYSIVFSCLEIFSVQMKLAKLIRLFFGRSISNNQLQIIKEGSGSILDDAARWRRKSISLTILLYTVENTKDFQTLVFIIFVRPKKRVLRF